MQQSVLFHAEPIYEEVPGWKGQDITGCTTFEELPETAQSYILHLEELVGAKISLVSVAPERDATIFRDFD